MKFFFDLSYNVFHQPRPAEHDARLHIGDGVRGDDALRRFDLHAREFRRAARKAFQRAFDPRGDDAADKFARCAENVEGRRGAEIDDDNRLSAAVFFERGDVVDHAVRPHLVRVVHTDLQTRFQPGRDLQRHDAEIHAEHMLDGIVERRDDGREDAAPDVGRRYAVDGKHIDDLRAVLVGRAFEIGRDAERNFQRVPVEHGVFDIGIPDVNAENHAFPFLLANRFSTTRMTVQSAGARTRLIANSIKKL